MLSGHSIKLALWRDEGLTTPSTEKRSSGLNCRTASGLMAFTLYL